MPSPENSLTAKELSELLQTSRLLSSQLDLTSLLETILQRSGQLTNSPAGSVFLFDERRNQLYVAAAAGDQAPMLLEEYGEAGPKRIPLESKAGRVFLSGESVIENTVQDDPEHFKGIDEEARTQTTSMVCVPLEVADFTRNATRLIGAIQILNKRDGGYTAHDCVLLEQFASHAAVAIQNASLLKDLLAHMGLYTAGNARELLRELNAAAHSEVLTLLFADMRGFTQLCQILKSDQQVQALLGNFLTMLSEQILDHDGTINKFLGDGVFAFFRGADAPRRAVQCAFDILAAFVELRERWDREHNQDLTFLDIGCGIVTDSVMLGAIGSGRVRDFTAIGPAVNLAAAFEKRARNGRRILVNQATYTAVEDMRLEVEGPLPFELRKPDQQVGIPYKMYHLVTREQARTLPAASAPDARIFLCHSSGDKPHVRRIYQRLKQDGFHPWLDEEELLGGQNWEDEIRKAVRNSNAVVVCLSPGSVTKSGFLNRELKYVLDVADEQPEGAIFVIPVKLEECDIPERLRKTQFINYHEDRGHERLLRALRQLPGRGNR